MSIVNFFEVIGLQWSSATERMLDFFERLKSRREVNLHLAAVFLVDFLRLICRILRFYPLFSNLEASQTPDLAIPFIVASTRKKILSFRSFCNHYD